MTSTHWNELSANLALRRNLQSLLRPAGTIVTRATQETRERHRIHKHNIWQAYNIKDDDAAQDRITTLKAHEFELWQTCRPELD